MITGEWSPTPVGPMHSRRKTNNQKARTGRPEWRHRAAVIVRVSSVDVVEKRGKPRTGTTGAIKRGRGHAAAAAQAALIDRSCDE